MVNKNLLEEKLNLYRQEFDSRWKNEKFKWEAIKTFQDNWDIDADDFAGMLNKSLSKTDDLFIAKNYFPKGMIEGFAEAAPEKTREMFQMLFDEEKAIADRMIKFRDESEHIRDKYMPDAKSTYQDAFAVSVYLWLRYPDKYYIYKYSVVKAAAECLGSDYQFKKGAYAADLQNNTAFFDEIREHISTETELLGLFKSQLTDDCYPDPNYRTLAFDFGYFVGRYLKDDEPQDDKKTAVKDAAHYWLYSPGTNAEHWDEFYDAGIMAIGWDEIGDLSSFNDKEAIQQKMQDIYKDGRSHSNDALALWQFVHDLKPGDIIFAKKGRRQIIGRGVVDSDYIYDADRGYYKNVRRVKWTHNEEHTFSKAVAMKTLTDITQHKNDVDQLNAMFEEKSSETEPIQSDREESECGYWWLNANPKIWSFSGMNIGDEQSYTLYNENGNKRRIFQNFLDAREGDMVIGYESYPVKQILAVCCISAAQDGKEIKFEKMESLANPIDYTELKNAQELANMECFVNPNGSLFRLTKDEYDFIMDLIREENPKAEKKDNEKYTRSNFLNEVFMSEEQHDKLVSVLMNKKNIILQGAPGVGKTYTAKRLAYSIMGEENDDRIKFVQFHQNYSYEDFVMGYKPSDDGFKLEKGIFYQFCKKAENQPDKDFFFIIDEINRGNMSKIFGELLMLIETDYRGEKINLAYNDELFSVPKNLYIIGMMNTADRSLALIDYALRRRFSFFEIEPGFDSEQFIKYQKELNNDTFNRLIDKVKELNRKIANDASLGKGFCIGHSYFSNWEKEECTDEKMREVVDFEILPMLEEYWFDDNSELQYWNNGFHGVFQ